MILISFLERLNFKFRHQSFSRPSSIVHSPFIGNCQGKETLSSDKCSTIVTALVITVASPHVAAALATTILNYGKSP